MSINMTFLDRLGYSDPVVSCVSYNQFLDCRIRIIFSDHETATDVDSSQQPFLGSSFWHASIDVSKNFITEPIMRRYFSVCHNMFLKLIPGK